MKTLLLATTCATLLATPSLACRGTAEYPEVMAVLAEANLPEAQKAAYLQRLEEGAALHHQGHDSDDMALRQQSLAILDEIMAFVAP